jgi:hypothetical protein
LARREKIYRDQRINLWSVTPSAALRIPKDGPEDPFTPPVRTIQDYYYYSGDTVAADTMRKFNRRWEGAALEALGLLSYLVAVAGPAKSLSGPYLLAGFDAGFAGCFTLTLWGNGEYVVPAAEHFNAYLRRDLGLEGDPNLGDRAWSDLAPMYRSAGRPEWYWSLGWGMAWNSTYDLANYFRDSWSAYGSYGNQFSLGAGTILPGGMTLEIRSDALIRGEHGLWYNVGQGQPSWVLDLVSYDVGLAPGFTFPLLDLGHHFGLRAFVGCQAGPGFLMSRGFADDPAGNLLGGYYLRQVAFDGGPLLRIETSGAPRGSLGFELGYRYEKFTDIPVNGAGGVFNGMPSPLRNVAGAPASLDFSGPFAELVFQFGRFRAFGPSGDMEKRPD